MGDASVAPGNVYPTGDGDPILLELRRREGSPGSDPVEPSRS
ncbi:MAG TPA: hypothetical protein VFG35_03365 [Actinoplanes sp.]|nr:hypothetical protein [Actinoplanes sp.]